MEHIFSKEHLLQIAGECSLLSRQKRPEVQWLNNRYILLKSKMGFRRKSETDRYLSEKIFSKEQTEASDILKIRYWRTGSHTPVNRDLCWSFGEALELSSDDMRTLMLSFFDKSMYVYSGVPDMNDPHYQEKYSLITQLIDSYFNKVSETQLKNLNIPVSRKKDYLRHLYFTDAARYISTMQYTNDILIQKHIYSSAYGSELHRTLNLIGEIPRKTIIRHLLILGMPDITLKQLNEQLVLLDYLPLTPEHTLVTGERLDLLLIQLITLYEKYCALYGIEKGTVWMQESCRILDKYFVQQDQKRLRFMYFKSLKE